MSLASPAAGVQSPRADAGRPDLVPVLIVDDNKAKRLALKSVLLPLGYDIVEADSGIAALRCVMARDFAVILLDVCMPITDGFETAALIRRRRQSEWTPIIFVTGYANDEQAKTDHYAQGAVDFIFSPVHPDELRSKVSAFANLFARARELAAQACRVQASADQLRLLTDAAPIGIFQTDSENRYVYTNPRWTEITGVAAADAAGRELGVIVARDRGADEPADADAGDSCRRVELRTSGPAPVIAVVTSRPIPGERGGITGWVGTLADVSAEVEAAAALVAARDAAVNANAMQQSFATSASHELRTPTTSILGYSEEILESDSLCDQDRKFMEIVYRNAQRLSVLIEDLLIVGEAEIGASMMHVAPTDLVPLVARVMSNFSGAAQRAGIALVTDHEPGAPAALVDPLRLEQALSNLISNAVKFTTDGVITVGVRRRDDAVEISVADSGTGIDPLDIEHIFGRFYRTQVAMDSSVKGSGLGLAIAHQMVEAQNGHLRASSDLGRGSTFTMSLPVAPAELQLA